MLIKLESVGSVLDTKELMVYPMFNNGTIDIEDGTELNEETPNEWYSSLSEEDRMVVAITELEHARYMSQ